MSIFWADQIVKEVLKRKEKSYLVTDYKTPSGKIHVGALRGVIIHDVVYRGLIDAGVEVEYWYGFDDLDPMDDLSQELEKDFKKYMGRPLCNIPSPVEDYNSYVEYFAKDFRKVYQSLGVKSKTLWASKLYRSGKYNRAIKIILDNADKIRQIYQEISGSQKPKDWYAFQVVCPKCGKIGTTRVYDWDGKKVSFVCEPKMVNWAQGCGYKGKILPYDGNGKMPYKVETAAKWFTFGTSVELAGKDHYTKGGTFYVARAIAEQDFKTKPAYGSGYEWFLIGGKKMSSSKGIGVSSSDIAEILPPELLRFLMVRTRAKRTIDFDPFGETIPRLYDEYDRCIDAYSKDPKSEFGRAYHYSKINNRKPPKYRLRFSKIAYLLQMFRSNTKKYAEEEKNAKLTNDEKTELRIREKYAQKWLDTYAPENYKFEIRDEIPEEARKLDDGQKKFLTEITRLLAQKKWQSKATPATPEQIRLAMAGEELHQQIHKIKKELNLEPRQSFSAIYLSLLGKDSGPQAGWLLANLDREFIIKRFREVVKLIK